ncbi:glucose-6-phosphate 1-dehydrogenase, cytoplasmic [Cymbomonas tetramitiformis]|uniref:Glucose-6-phosphate 1-dehydrogenase n=1 Tax=Cymbomonas tetramitiformis TaxID=36881 RepID=A0AAE0KYM2_9CHLO|nr:glucose-6-phosphate 1-dehydrogenase, cytoplasmic [Cymbomonas tetramitiformis]
MSCKTFHAHEHQNHSQLPRLQQTRSSPLVVAKEKVSITVFGASGDLAVKKLFPALFRLRVEGLIPSDASIFGYARSKLPREKFESKLTAKIPSGASNEAVASFVAQCSYVSGAYDKIEDFTNLRLALEETERGSASQLRIYYLSLPESTFETVCRGIRNVLLPAAGESGVRIVLEKPFGKDTASYLQLSRQLSPLFPETNYYRIDHYLAKEMIQTIVPLRFSNPMLESTWNSSNICSVEISFKEKIGTEGRGGYFDGYGIIRDVVQNHLLQVLALIAMEPPATVDASAIRCSKATVLREVAPARFEECLVGQYGRSLDGKEQGYLEDPTVPAGSKMATYARFVLHVNTPRWKGVPFIITAGKALDEQKVEVRMKYRGGTHATSEKRAALYPGSAGEELVIRVQPDEAVLLNLNTKLPGLSQQPDDRSLVRTAISLDYKVKYPDVRLPDAYEQLLLDVFRGDQQRFVGDDELETSWNIVSPLLHAIERADAAPPMIYPFGSSGPPSSLHFPLSSGQSKL